MRTRTQKTPVAADLKASCDRLATLHQDSRNLVTRLAGAHSGTVIYVTRDPVVVGIIDRLLGDVRQTEP